MYWTEAWVAILTAGLAFSVYLQLLKNWNLDGRITNLVASTAARLAGKRDKRPYTPKPRAHRVDTVFHDRDDEGREHWLCVNCGTYVPQMGHTIAACEKCQAEVAEANAEAENANTEQIAEAVNKTD